ncbi:MAG: redoxin domain-containing protein [Taibaiella sp.]|nr:redoxin domain-containing protein [Taibaiella sp.]
MKKFTLAAVLLMLCTISFSYGRTGYHVELKLTDTKDTLAFLAHYYAKPLPTIYKTDSAHFNKNGVAIFDSKEHLNGGIYILMLSDHKTYIEFLLDDGDNMSIALTTKKLPEGVVFKNSPQNEDFQNYSKFIKEFGEKQQGMMANFSHAKNAADSDVIRKGVVENSKSLIEYRRSYARTHPNTLLAHIFGALEVPQVPGGDHLLPDGKTDSLFTYHYYKAHFWDHFEFQDDRLINAPIYDLKLSEYINKEVYPYPDSVEHEADILLAKTKGTKELFKYTLSWLANFGEDSKIMGMDEVFVYLVENYYMKGDATWVDAPTLDKFIDRAMKIAPNVIGNVAPEVKMVDVDQQEHRLSSVKAKYTVLVFWSPDCGHCQQEIPLLDSVYNAQLKAKGVKVYAVRTEGTDQQWQEFIKKHKLEDWINVYDPKHTSDYRSKYDVYSTPTMYLLDEKKIIRGKRLDHSSIMEVIQMQERKERDARNKS